MVIKAALKMGIPKQENIADIPAKAQEQRVLKAAQLLGVPKMKTAPRK